MNVKPILGINFDEVSDDLSVATDLIKEMGLGAGELRTINGKNFVFWDDQEVSEFKQHVDSRGIKVVAAASPLFKWYSAPDDSEVAHDSFGFNPRLSEEEKRTVITKAIETAAALSIPRIRIFSELGSGGVEAAKHFAKQTHLVFALQEAKKYGIDLFIENEPVCRINTKEELLSFFENNEAGNLRLWLDIANLLELGEEIDNAFLEKVAPYIGYIHVKDFIIENGIKKYVAVGKGQIDYRDILSRVLRYCPTDTIITVETHAKSNKVDISRESLSYVKALLSELGEKE